MSHHSIRSALQRVVENIALSQTGIAAPLIRGTDLALCQLYLSAEIAFQLESIVEQLKHGRTDVSLPLDSIAQTALMMSGYAVMAEPSESPATLTEYAAAEVAAGRWHQCPSINEIRPVSVDDCTHCQTPPAPPVAPGTLCRDCPAMAPVAPDHACSHPTRQHSWERVRVERRVSPSPPEDLGEAGGLDRRREGSDPRNP